MKWVKLIFFKLKLILKRFFMSDTLVLSENTDPRGIKKNEVHYAQVLHDAYGNKTIQFFVEKIPYQAEYTDINISEIACCTRIFDQTMTEEGRLDWVEIEESKQHQKSRFRLTK